MSVLDDARSRIRAALQEVERLKQSEFPYDHSRKALDRVEDVFRKYQTTSLDKLHEGSDVVVRNNACSYSIDLLFLYLPILGFILRSTNVRNAFETWSPLLRLARRILSNPSTKLLLSSEWDYSPFVFSRIKELPEFVLIGLPASESANPLLVPLAGHELGHSLWAHEGVELLVEDAIAAEVVKGIRERHWDLYHKMFPQYDQASLESNVIARATWMPAHTWGMLQAEEIFCDILGLILFDRAYLHAFAYLISPRAPGERSVGYPNLQRRVEHLIDAAADLGVELPPDYADRFEDMDEPTDPGTALLVTLADEASRSVFPQLLQLARRLMDERSVPRISPDRVAEITEWIGTLVPANGNQSLVDILNAAWDLRLKPDLWIDAKQIPADEREEVLKEIVLKSFEVQEIEERTRDVA